MLHYTNIVSYDDDDDVQSRQKKTLIIMCELDMADVSNILTNVLGVRMSR